MRFAWCLAALLVLLLLLLGCTNPAPATPGPLRGKSPPTNGVPLLQTQSYAYCEAMDNYDDQDACYRGLNLAACDLLPKDKVSFADVTQEDCYFAVARTREDASLCGKMKEGDGCYDRMAFELMDESLCDKIKDASEWRSLRGSCYIALAAAKKDFGLCTRAGFPEEKLRWGEFLFKKSSCYGLLVHDADTCRGLKEVVEQEACLAGLVPSTRDVSLCEGLTNAEIRDFCFLVCLDCK